MAERIDTALARQLDSFTVPPLSAGFADHVVARAMAEPASGEIALPRLRSALPRRRWLRLGGMGLGVIAAGMISISAAAAGYFGEPISHVVHRAPVIGVAISRVIPEHPHHRLAASKPPAPAIRAHPVVTAVAPVAPAAPATEVAPTAQEARAAWREVHPKAARRIERRREWLAAHPEIELPVRPVRADRIERRPARLRLRQRIEAARNGEAMVQPSAAPVSPLRARRFERLRELRRLRREAQAAPPPGDPLP